MAAFGMSKLVSAIKTVVILVKTGCNGISIAIFTIYDRLKTAKAKSDYNYNNHTKNGQT